MKKVICAIVAGVAIVLGSALPGLAMAGPGVRPGGGAHPGISGHSAFQGQGHHEFGGHHEFEGRRDFHSRIFIGPGFWWGPGYPYYADPPVIVEPAPPVYIQPGTPPDQAGYWYYCQNPPGYYPYIKECPAGWMAVVPQPTPLAQ